MKLNLEHFDHIIEELHENIYKYTIQLEKNRANLTNLENHKKEMELRVEDMNKIIAYYQNNTDDTHAVFSPIISNNENNESIDLKKRELETLNHQFAIVKEQLIAKKTEVQLLEEKIDGYVDILANIEKEKTLLQKQVDVQNNEQLIHDLKEVQQKKRLIHLEKTKYHSVVDKINRNVMDIEEDVIQQLRLVLGFTQSDPLRAKQELQTAIDRLQSGLEKGKIILNKITEVEPDALLCDLLNSYIGEIVRTYPEIQFKMVASNLKQINHISSDFNRCLISFIKAMINSFILKCNPKKVHLRFAYEDGFLNITGTIEGTYINFYNEMKSNETSMIATLYEKCFLLDGQISFKDNKNGSFQVCTEIPVKNYLL